MSKTITETEEVEMLAEDVGDLLTDVIVDFTDIQGLVQTVWTLADASEETLDAEDVRGMMKILRDQLTDILERLKHIEDLANSETRPTLTVVPKRPKRGGKPRG